MFQHVSLITSQFVTAPKRNTLELVKLNLPAGKIMLTVDGYGILSCIH